MNTRTKALENNNDIQKTPRKYRTRKTHSRNAMKERRKKEWERLVLDEMGGQRAKERRK